MEWISLEKQLPEPGSVILVWMPDSQYNVELVRYEGKHGFYDLTNDWEAHGNVTHWMPIVPPGG